MVQSSPHKIISTGHCDDLLVQVSFTGFRWLLFSLIYKVQPKKAAKWNDTKQWTLSTHIQKA